MGEEGGGGGGVLRGRLGWGVLRGLRVRLGIGQNARPGVRAKVRGRGSAKGKARGRAKCKGQEAMELGGRAKG